MPRKKKVKKKIAIALDPEVLESIDRLAEKLEVPRSHMIENLVLTALDDAKLLDSLGLLDFVIKVRAFKEYLDYKLGRRPLFDVAT